MVLEERYYRNVAVWLERKGYYVGREETNGYQKKILYINCGPRKAKVDVVGVKNVGKSYIDKIEIAIIEVKTHRPSLRDIEQTYGYSIFRHKCYLATTSEITQENITDAGNFGIGLLQIPHDFHRKKPNLIRKEDIEIVLSPQTMEPREADMTDFLVDYLSIFKCTLCGCYFLNLEENDEFPTLPPKGLSFKRLERNKIFSVFPDQTEEQFKSVRNYKLKIWRHICLRCVRDLAKLYEIDNLKKKIEKLELKIKKLKQSKS